MFNKAFYGIDHPHDRQAQLLHQIKGALVLIQTNYDYEEKSFNAGEPYLLAAIENISFMVEILEEITKKTHEVKLAV